MKTIPLQNSTALNLPRFIREFCESIPLKNKVVSAILYGSYARGDATEKSDINILIVCDYIDASFLLALKQYASACEKNTGDAKISLLCVGEKELESGCEGYPISLLSLYFEGVLMYGKDVFSVLPTEAGVKSEISKILSLVLYRVSSLIFSEKPVLAAALVKDVLNPLMAAFRLERLISTNEYPENNKTLFYRYGNEGAAIVVDFVLSDERLLKALDKNADGTLLFIAEVAEQLI